MWKLVVIGAALALNVQTAAAQQPSTGAEPPAARKPAAPKAAPVASPPAAGGDPVQLSTGQIESKIQELTRTFKELQSRIGLGNSVAEKWAGIAELHSGFAQAANEAALRCDVDKGKLKQAKEAGYSELTTAEIQKQVKNCDSEVYRTNSVLKIYANQIAMVQKEVTRIGEEAKVLGEMAEGNAKDRKRLEAEKALGNSLDAAKTAVQTFDPNRKRVTN